MVVELDRYFTRQSRTKVSLVAIMKEKVLGKLKGLKESLESGTVTEAWKMANITPRLRREGNRVQKIIPEIVRTADAGESEIT
eukprot:g33869.t1